MLPIEEMTWHSVSRWPLQLHTAVKVWQLQILDFHQKSAQWTFPKSYEQEQMEQYQNRLKVKALFISTDRAINIQSSQ